MGAYGGCWLGRIDVGGTYKGVDPTLITLFRRTDRFARPSNSPDLPAVIADNYRHFDGVTEEVVDCIYYSAPAWMIRDRLELFGYTLDTAKRLYELGRDLYIAETKSYGIASQVAEERERLERLRKWTADDFMKHVRAVSESRKDITNIIQHVGIDDANRRSEKSAWFGYDAPDILVQIRLALEALPDADEFIYDLTDLILSGYYAEEDDVVEQVLAAPAIEYAHSSRVIVLTEGKSDAEILKSAMDLLCPHLADYFTFMEFDEFRVRGGAGALASLVKAFAGAGIVNRMIALFDNDTAAAAALASLRQLRLPQNIVILRLPRSPALTSYPTIGPTGLAPADINGVAASIELFLGEDVLRSDDGTLPPIVWTGYEPSVERYQGGLPDNIKAAVHSRFAEKVRRCLDEPEALKAADWSGVKLIIESMMSAFHVLDEKQLERWLRQAHAMQTGDFSDEELLRAPD
jgi:hypothetical protein